MQESAILISMKITFALIGRPNVGKSALFNRILGKRISIVDTKEGATRDRIYGEGECFGRSFQIVDTGGLDPMGKALFAEEIKRQVDRAVEEAHCLILVVDGTVGVTHADEHIIHAFKRIKKPLCLAVNKIDAEHQEGLLAPFYRLGILEVIPVSAIQGRNVAELLEKALSVCPVLQQDKALAPKMKVAFIGRPNVGKSTMINQLAAQERCIVSALPQTTRESIEVDVSHCDETVTFIDTAGICRKKAESKVVDKFAAIRTERAIARADLCVLMLDARSGLSQRERRMINQIESAHRGCLLFFNKWDLIKGVRMEHCYKQLGIEASFAMHCPTLFGSAKTGRCCVELVALLNRMHRDFCRRVTTGEMNRFLNEVTQRRCPPFVRGKRLRIYYMAQIEVAPPRFLLFINDKNCVSKTYMKYLISQLRKAYHFSGIPLLLSFREKNRPSHVTSQGHAPEIAPRVEQKIANHTALT